MLDRIDYQIAEELAEHHNYPYAQNIYSDIFKAFSYFPISLSKLNIESESESIVFIALVIRDCLKRHGRNDDFELLFRKILSEMNYKAAEHMPQDITVETFLGCALYYFHPLDLRSSLFTIDLKRFFNNKQLHEYEIKKKTVFLFVV
ncbi:MAG: hypothetical protein JXR46_07965 [Calditrichaceae bacterium]|nr:hypothetical protein [Calditrichaceae bacterium]MBN2708964.1 hypothetical protein [Calditrichaceae bacterium]RQV97513.1 MAG: hypothetical protein EH224_00395 [Calditrichota bacterium]